MKSSAELNSLFPEQHIFFSEDIDEEMTDKEAFLQKIHAVFRYHPKEPLSKIQTNKIRAYIFPEYIVGMQQDLINIEQEEHPVLPDFVKIMDDQQEIIARNMSGGHRVIHGVAGSGKTLILEHRARKLAEEANGKPVLVLCFNVMLAARLRNNLQAFENIAVFHFHGWCGELKKKYNIDVPYGDRYFERLTDAVCEAVENSQIPNGQYFAVLIDEGQDFAAEWLKAAAKMSAPEHEHLLLLYDDAQSIYDNRCGLDFKLNSVGIKAQGRTIILRVNYRNPQEIMAYTDQFIWHFLTERQTVEGAIPLVKPQACGLSTGVQPLFYKYDSYKDEFDGIIAQIGRWNARGIALGKIAVLCAYTSFAKGLCDYLKTHEIAVQRVIEKVEKENFHPCEDKIVLCCIASSKGSEFEYVIVAGIGQCNDSDERCAHDARLIYVGMTRATNELVVTAHGKNSFTTLLSE